MFSEMKIICGVFVLVAIMGTNGQFFGGVSRLPGGGNHQTAGFQAGPAWGSVSKTVDSRGFSSPNTFSGGLGHTSPNLHGLSGSISHTPGLGGSASVGGQLGLLNTPNHQATAWAQHQRNMDTHFRPVGPPTNSAGLNYAHGSGSTAFINGAKTPGFPAVGTVGGSVPLVQGKDGGISLGAQTSFGHGMKPNHQVGVTGELKF